MFIDGVEKSSGQFTVNLNHNLPRDANIVYITTPGDVAFRAEVDHYTVPAIELGDNIQTSFNNTFSVANTSYDPASPTYNGALTANSFRVELATTPTSNLAGFTFINLEKDPVGTIANVSGNSATLDFTEASFPSTFNLSNNRIYNLNMALSLKNYF